ncbi:MAG: hypothetical protein BGN91_09720 [Nitrobacter sp. 62-13]|nr:MAG: hypothetical protein BGN91_09720 [Nitrobacter sp. 62-13]
MTMPAFALSAISFPLDLLIVVRSRLSMMMQMHGRPMVLAQRTQCENAFLVLCVESIRQLMLLIFANIH